MTDANASDDDASNENENETQVLCRFDTITGNGEGNYATYESSDVTTGPQEIVGFNIDRALFQKAGRDEPFDAVRAGVREGEHDEGVTLERTSESTNYLVFESALVSPIYLHRDLFDTEPEQVTIRIEEAEIEEFEAQETDAREDEADELLA